MLRASERYYTSENAQTHSSMKQTKNNNNKKRQHRHRQSMLHELSVCSFSGLSFVIYVPFNWHSCCSCSPCHLVCLWIFLAYDDIFVFDIVLLSAIFCQWAVSHNRMFAIAHHHRSLAFMNIYFRVCSIYFFFSPNWVLTRSHRSICITFHTIFFCFKTLTNWNIQFTPFKY